MIEVVCWYLLIMMLGLIALPVSFVVFGRLPDRGYSFSKPLGLLLAGLLAWWIGNLQIIGFTWKTCWLAVVLLELLAFLLVWRKPGLRESMWAWFKQGRNLSLILGSELVFLAGFAFMLNARSYIIEQHPVSEKFFNLSFINAIVVSSNLPPPDPWFNGQPMNYYYGGHLLLAFLCKLSGIGANIGYNLGMGLIFGMALQASFGLVGNLAALNGARQRTVIGIGVLGAAFLMVLANLGPLKYILKNGFLPWGDKNFPLNLDWYNTSRLIFDLMPDGKVETILTEYPISSYLKGDLHAYQLSIPYIILVLGLIVSIMVAPTKWTLARPHLRALPRLVLTGILVGSLNFINGVDFPTYFGMVIMVMGLLELRLGSRWWASGLRWAAQSVALYCVIKIAYIFYSTDFASMLKSKPQPDLENIPIYGTLSGFLGWVNWNRTNLSEYLWMFGLFLLPIFTWYALQLGRFFKAEKSSKEIVVPFAAPIVIKITGLLLLLTAAWALVLAYTNSQQSKLVLKDVAVPLVALVVAGVALWPGVWRQMWQRPTLTLEGLLGLVIFALGPQVGLELLGPLVFLIYCSIRFILKDFASSQQGNFWLSRSQLFAVVSIALASLMILFSELIWVRDVYNNRYNTVLKFWQEAWILYGLAGAFLTWQVMVRRQAPVSGPEAETVLGREFSQPSDKPLQTQGGGLRPRFPDLDGSFTSFLQSDRVGQFLIKKITLKKTFTYPISVDGGSSQSVTPATHVITGEKPGKTPKLIRTGHSFNWRWLWISLLGLLILSAATVPTLGFKRETGNYTDRVNLTGEGWYIREFPYEYHAMQWFRNYLKADAAHYGIVLEANPMNYSYGGRISTYTGLPTIVGWPFHELQWRGYLPEMAIWGPWLDMNKIYETTDQAVAQELLKKYNVRYVFVGQIENGTNRPSENMPTPRNYSPAALGKFAKFMKTIYADPENNIYIYAFE